MPEPCRSCDRRFIDGGGCRCQAYALTGEATRTDPVCRWAPDHALVEAAVAEAGYVPRETVALSTGLRRHELAYRGEGGGA